LKKIMIFLICTLSACAEKFDPNKFDAFLREHDYQGCDKYLKQFETIKADADVEAARSQLLIEVGSQDTLSYESTKNAGSVLKTVDKKENAVGYLNYQNHKDPKSVNDGVQGLQAAIKKYPKRIDMRLWLVDFYRLEKQYPQMEELVSQIYQESANNKFQWLTRLNKPIDDGREFVIGNLQGHFSHLFEERTDEAEVVMKQIAELMIKYQPEHVYGHNGLGMLHLYNKRYAQAVPFLEQAHKIAPDDDGVMRNLGLTYQRLGQKNKAREIYNKILSSSNTRFHDWVQQKMKEL